MSEQVPQNNPEFSENPKNDDEARMAEEEALFNTILPKDAIIKDDLTPEDVDWDKLDSQERQIYEMYFDGGCFAFQRDTMLKNYRIQRTVDQTEIPDTVPSEWHE